MCNFLLWVMGLFFNSKLWEVGSKLIFFNGWWVSSPPPHPPPHHAINSGTALIYNHLIVIITMGHNSANTDPSAPVFLSHMHCVMVQAWFKLYQNWTDGIEVIVQKPYLLTESQNARIMTC